MRRTQRKRPGRASRALDDRGDWGRGGGATGSVPWGSTSRSKHLIAAARAGAVRAEGSSVRAHDVNAEPAPATTAPKGSPVLRTWLSSTPTPAAARVGIEGGGGWALPGPFGCWSRMVATRRRSPPRPRPATGQSLDPIGAGGHGSRCTAQLHVGTAHDLGCTTPIASCRARAAERRAPPRRPSRHVGGWASRRPPARWVARRQAARRRPRRAGSRRG